MVEHDLMTYLAGSRLVGLEGTFLCWDGSSLLLLTFSLQWASAGLLTRGTQGSKEQQKRASAKLQACFNSHLSPHLLLSHWSAGTQGCGGRGGDGSPPTEGALLILSMWSVSISLNAWFTVSAIMLWALNFATDVFSKALKEITQRVWFWRPWLRNLFLGRWIAGLECMITTLCSDLFLNKCGE